MRNLLMIALVVGMLSGANAAEPLWRANFAAGGNVSIPHRHFQGAPSEDGGSIRFPHTSNRIDVKAFPAFDGRRAWINGDHPESVAYQYVSSRKRLPFRLIPVF